MADEKAKSKHPSKNEWIERRAHELWAREGFAEDREQDCWDKAVQEFEAGSSEDERGPAHSEPAVAQGDEPIRKP